MSNDSPLRARLADSLDLSSHSRAVAEALFVTFLWSTSYVFIAVGLRELPALAFAGLRYGLAALVLLPLFVRAGGHRQLRGASGRELGAVAVLGLLAYAVTQGAQFLALEFLPAVTVSLVLSFTPAAVAFVGVPLLGERPTLGQVAGLALLLSGVVAYFGPGVAAAGVAGLAAALVALGGNALASIFGRAVNRDGALDPLAVTTVSMGIGAAALLTAGAAAQGLPAPSLRGWAIVGWLAVVNTAFAFTLWNRTLRTLSAVESSVVNNAMLVQVGALGWLFLGESLGARELLGVGLVAVGALVVQVRR